MVDTANTAWQRKVFCRDLMCGICGGKIQVFPDGDVGDFVAKQLRLSMGGRGGA